MLAEGEPGEARRGESGTNPLFSAFRSESMDAMNFRLGLSHLLRRLAGLVEVSAAARPRARMPRSFPPSRRCATSRSGCAWCGARPGSACTRSTGSRGGATGRPSCARCCACRTISTSTPAPTCSSASCRTRCARRSATSCKGSLAPESGGDYEDEHRITRFDGSTGWILLRGKTFFAEGPEGRRATRSIGLSSTSPTASSGEEANALHASTVLSSNDAIFSIDPAQIIRTWNRGAERLYGYSAAEAIGRPLTIICPDDLRDELAGLYAKTIAGEPVVMETVRRHKDGRLDPGRHQRRADLRCRASRGRRRGGASRHDRAAPVRGASRLHAARAVAPHQEHARGGAGSDPHDRAARRRHRGFRAAAARLHPGARLFARPAGAARLAGRDAGRVAAGPARAVRRDRQRQIPGRRAARSICARRRCSRSG